VDDVAGVTTAAVEAEALVKHYGSRAEVIEAVRGVDLRVETGEVFGFLGPNGAGKSTTVRMLTTLLSITSGTASVAGVDVGRDPDAARRRIGVALQEAGLDPRQTGRELLVLQGRLFGMSTHDSGVRAKQLLALVELEDAADRRIKGYSGGMKRRLDLASALVHEPEVLFLDEPTIGLDLLAKQRFRELLVRLNEERRTTIFLTSHDVADIEHVARRAIVINHGAVIYDDEVAAMRRSLLSTKQVEVGLGAPCDAPAMLGVSVVTHTEASLRLIVDTTQTSIRSVLDALLDGAAVDDISVVDPPLEEVIAEIYGLPQR
jgi:ABC-2 type transport system ATP-binding protein